MYKCEKCGKTTKPNEKLNRLVVQTREKNYSNKFIDKNGKECEKITTGYEIVKEINVCKECFAQTEFKKPMDLLEPTGFDLIKDEVWK